MNEELNTPTVNTEVTPPSEIVIPNISYEFPYTPDIRSIKIVTETETGEVIAVNTIPESVITELTRIDNIIIPNIQYDVPYTDDLENIKIVTTLSDDTIIGINNITKKAVYDPITIYTQKLEITGNEVSIDRIRIIEEIPSVKTGKITYKIDGITNGFVDKATLEDIVNVQGTKLENNTILKFKIETTDSTTSPELVSIDLGYTTLSKTYKTITNPRNLTHMINKLDGQINGYTHVSGNKLITNKATIQNYRVLLADESIVLHHIEDSYGYRSVEVSIEEDGYVTPLSDNQIKIIKSERKNTIIIPNSEVPLNKYLRVSITVPKND